MSGEPQAAPRPARSSLARQLAIDPSPPSREARRRPAPGTGGSGRAAAIAALFERSAASAVVSFQRFPPMSFPRPALLLPVLLAACGGEDTPGFVERPLSDSEKEFRLVESSMERFRYSAAEPGVVDGAGGASEGASATGLVYGTPEGWTEKPGSPMRDVNFTFGPNAEGECYIARLPGAGGGLAANVNRWRSQMGAAPLSEEEIAALPTRPLFGQPARFVSVDGTFSPGMGGGEAFPGYRLVGLILSGEGGAVFVKMTGPEALVEQNGAAFDQFVSSLGVNAN